LNTASDLYDESTDGKPDNAPSRKDAITGAIAIVCAFLGCLAFMGWAVGHGRAYEASLKAVHADVVTFLSTQGATVQDVDCVDLDTCTAIIDGSTYTVTIQVDDQGNKVYGVSAFVGDRTSR
jgi:hypothetical protein